MSEYFDTINIAVEYTPLKETNFVLVPLCLKSFGKFVTVKLINFLPFFQRLASYTGVMTGPSHNKGEKSCVMNLTMTA